MTASPLCTDLYQLTMMAGYFESRRHETQATFELFVRRLPPQRAYLVAAGLDTALEFLEALRFDAADVAWLRSLPVFHRVSAEFFEYLRALRFTGDVWAMPEGTPFFPNQPILRVTAPLAEAQLVETALLAIVNYQTSVASKAARIVQAAGGRPVMEFGARRAHGTAAALVAARAAYLSGCAGTSFVEAGRRFGIPLSGTMAHSWVLAADDESAAFASYSNLYQEHTVLLLDTYDTIAAARKVVAAGLRPSAIRLDSGDLLQLSMSVRGILDAAGLTGTRIVASGDLDEWQIAALLAGRAPIDGFGVGTALTTSEDAPALGGVYKLVAIGERGATRPVMKRSTGKATWPGEKQVWRVRRGAHADRDMVCLASEPGPTGGRPLIAQVMAGGRRSAPAPVLADARRRAEAARAELPPHLAGPDAAPGYVVDVGPVLHNMIDSGGRSPDPASRLRLS